MVMNELPNKHEVVVKVVDPTIQAEIDAITDFFQNEFVERYAIIRMHDYLGLPKDENEYELFTEAYKKEQRYRELTGKELLPEVKLTQIF